MGSVFHQYKSGTRCVTAGGSRAKLMCWTMGMGWRHSSGQTLTRSQCLAHINGAFLSLDPSQTPTHKPLSYDHTHTHTHRNTLTHHLTHTHHNTNTHQNTLPNTPNT